MAAIVVTKTVNRYQDRIKADRKHLADAIVGGSDQALKSLEVNILQLPDFEATGTTDTNTATSPILNLTDLGVPFAADTGRMIHVISAAWIGTAGGTQMNHALVRGHATTPVVEKLGQYGDFAVGAEEQTVAVQSNKVVVNCLGISGDVVTWYVKVWIGDAFPLVLV